MPVAPAQRTLLARRIQERHWTVEEFTERFNHTARRSLPGDRDHAISLSQAKRWVTGKCARPLPASRRVLEAMFGTDARMLLRPPGAPPDRDTALTTRDSVTDPCPPGDDGRFAAGPDEEVIRTHRRDLLSAGALLAATGATLGPADRAARISRALATSGDDPLTLAELQRGIHQLTRIYAVTPHATLIEPVERGWEDAEILLGACKTSRVRQDLELVAGQYAFYRGRLAFSMGDDRTALTFFVLAAQHADSAGDTLLSGSVDAMRAAVAFFAGEFSTAATISRRAQRGAHPYVVAQLASSLARSLAQTGDTDGALTALDTMRDNIWTGPPRPGIEPGNEEHYEAFSAVTLSYLGRGDQAEQHARASLALLEGTGRHVQIAGTQLALARAFLHRSHPEPEQAALAIRDALTAAEGNNHGATTDRAAAITHRLTSNPDWARLPTTRDLTDRLPNPRLPSPETSV
ncbi:hypothetical protein I6A60_38210 [Frankia sp. AgB1.9]|uniref:hypothetical protein n=1 Tax=unclassified Frankia TaxID=2632575 RepID=UPI001932D71A|nr:MULTISPECIES: hypothetical protein [unclassified Frankia]MBL7486760.1 hypothetical protein [Frankia sp. AgW1.1]MBL7553625.1 hypothetical protein [Frankia sp. AgB1.9]MBL7618398.1 hypothetical protein [Frankia sp. AgB1.8]